MDRLFNNPDLYPTPESVINTMLEGEIVEGKTILDPSAGTGNIVKHCQSLGAKGVIAFEINAALVKILQSFCPASEIDFLKVESHQISHVDLIVMNPPFSNAAQHINHAYNIAPAGCRIVALCNSETLKNSYSKSREELKNLIEMYGQDQDLGECFSTSERRTYVNVSLIKLEKPGSNYDQEFSGFFMEEDPEEAQANGLITYNVVRDLVNRYVASVKIYDKQIETAIQLGEITGEFYGGDIGFQATRNGAPLLRNEFKKGMQKAGWSWIFEKLNLTKHTTKGLREDINKFVETQENVPFTMKNIYRMLEIVIATTSQRMDKAIIEVFDKVTSYHDDNRYGLPGWKTNSHYLLTKKFIIPNLTYQDSYDLKYHKHEIRNWKWEKTEQIDDLVKALCYLTGDNYEDESLHRVKGQFYGSWFDWKYFRLKAFKKGTLHFEFKDEKVWKAFNQRVAKIKGYPLPEKKAQTAYQDRQNGRKPAQAAYKPAKQKPVILSTIKVG